MIIEVDALVVIGVDHDGLALSVFVDQVARNTGDFSKYQCASYPRNVDLSLGIRIIDAIGGQLAADVVHDLPIRKRDFEAHALQRRPAVQTAEFIERDRTLGLVTELQGNGLARLDGGGLGHIVQDVVLPGPSFTRYDGSSGVDIGNQDSPGAVRYKLAIGVSNHGPMAVGDKKFAVTQRFVGAGVNFLYQEGALGAVAKIELHHVLLLARDIGGLGCGVHHMIPVAG